ncbi:MAG: 2-amino-4-hydroxy-6-hydroxymethyldihydropteridine diphosphokinase [Gammaproteobacteria bacterium]|nr:2-amino-4-hydroxy-6-hydroxymethyldihydropteridine diphosphokinase [Gammaproteobacteria bacterium]
MTVRVYIGLGSNLEDPVAQVLEAVEELQMIPDSILVARSGLYGGKPMGPADQPDYVNAVVSMDTLLSAEDFLAALTRIEDLQGRERGGEKWGPRIIDLDLLLYGKAKINTPDLTVPHPGIRERDFVIIPLAELAGDLNVPGQGRLTALINKCENHSLKKLVTA